MKKLNGTRWGLWLTVALCMILCLGMLAGCDGKEPAPDTSAPTDIVTSAPTDEPTDVTTEAPAEETTEAPTEAVTELKGWEQDTGKFNDGIVIYEKKEDSQLVENYPAEKVGQLMSEGQTGVLHSFHGDFEDGDPTCGGDAAILRAGDGACVDGVMYVPYRETSENLLGGYWTTWSPNASASVKTFRQAQLSVEWTLHTAHDRAWSSAMWGCYVSSAPNKIPTEPGDGLWLSFNAISNKIHIYHPDDASWPAAWAAVSVGDDLLKGKHQLDILTSPDYSTYVYVTPAGSDTSRLVCTVRFAEGKIRVYNEANELVKEAACTTNALKGDRFNLFVHDNGGALVDTVDVYTASKGETLTSATITATPTEGNSLGLDITNKTDLVSICYSVWFDAILGVSGSGVDDWNNITEILDGKKDWGPYPTFHYWAKPALGYYSSSNKEVIRTHMTQLYTAGVDFIIIDLTNAGDNYLGSSAWTDYIEKPMDAIFETIMEMRVEGLGTPYVVFWVGTNDGPLYQALYDRYHAPEKWKDCFVYWDGKPFLLTTHTYPKDFPLPELFTVRSMWGLSVSYTQGQWSFLSTNNHNRVTRGPDKSAEQVSVAVASQADYMSNFNTAKGRDGGMFWYAQWQTAFDRHPKVVTLTWWNEWTAQRLRDPNGNYVFTDNYNAAYSRDIEPMEGGHGDQYYQWMIRYISAYKGGLECPVLIEEEYEDQLEAFMEAYRKGRN